MKAIIMAGGEGTRLRPLTCTIPKPMVPIVNKPVMEYIIELLKSVSINEVNVTTCYLPTSISDYFGNGEQFNIKISYFTELTPLGTGGSVLNTGLTSKESIIVISGDCVTDIELRKAIEFHNYNHSKATLVLKREPYPLDYGIVILDKYNKITKFLEKPSWGEVFSDTVNTGIYILESEVFNYYKPGDRFDFSKDLFPKLLSDNVPMYGYVTQNYWNDVGDISSYKQTQFDILNHKVKLSSKYKEAQPGVFIGENTSISSNAIMNPPVVIGNNCTIKAGVVIGGYSIIGNNVLIQEGSTIKRSIIWDKVAISRNVQCRGTTICSNTIIEDNANIFENSIIGSDSVIHQGATINPEIKIWPSKAVEKNTIVNSNLIWGAKSQRFSYTNSSISGELNQEITPEYSSTLGSIFSTILKSKKPMIVSSDDSKQANYIKNSITTGILSTGKRVISLDNIITPISRYSVRSFNCCGGIHIRIDQNNIKLIHIELFNSYGGNIDRKSQRELDQLLQRGDFQRCNGDKIEDITEIHNYSSLYLQTNIAKLKNAPAIQNQQMDILLATSSNLVGNLAQKYLEALGCNITLFKLNNSDYQNDFKSSINQITRLMKKQRFKLGFLINDTGENITLLNENGTMLNSDTYRILTSIITLKSGVCKQLVVPVDSTNIINQLAQNYNIDIIRTHSSTTDIMNDMLKYGNSINDDYFQYSLNYDGILASGKILSYLSEKNITITDLLKEIPEFHIKKSEFDCDFEKRGFIIRKLIEDYENNSLEMFEGIKINSENGWALILPDNERPIFRILTEGCSEEFAEEISVGVNNKLKNLINLT